MFKQFTRGIRGICWILVGALTRPLNLLFQTSACGSENHLRRLFHIVEPLVCLAHEPNVELGQFHLPALRVANGEFGINLVECLRQGRPHPTNEPGCQARIVELLDARGDSLPKQVVNRQMLPPLEGVAPVLFDLTPLLQTSMNGDLRLDEAQARAVSPVFWPAPAGRVLDSLVGGIESSEFIRQAEIIADAWKAKTQTRFEIIPGANHFTAVDPLSDPRSAMTARMLELCRRT